MRKKRPQRQGLKPGTVVDARYTIIAPLGRGGFATVYVAEHARLGRRVALKVLDRVDSDAQNAARSAARFEREARVAASLEHPNSARVFEYGFGPGGAPYIAMELLEGRDLRTELRDRGPFGFARARSLFLGALTALADAHEAGVVHKDLKPSNLFLVAPATVDERLVVVDFGIAGFYETPETRLTQKGIYAGTPAYAAPEYITDQTIGPALDVYQAGLILAEAISGERVVRGPTAAFCLAQHCAGELPFSDFVRASPLAGVIERATHKDPRRRYPNARAMADALAAVAVEDTEPRARVTQRIAPPALGEAPVAREAREWNWVRWLALPLAGLAIAGLSLAAFGIGVGLWHITKSAPRLAPQIEPGTTTDASPELEPKRAAGARAEKRAPQLETTSGDAAEPPPPEARGFADTGAIVDYLLVEALLGSYADHKSAASVKLRELVERGRLSGELATLARRALSEAKPRRRREFGSAPQKWLDREVVGKEPSAEGALRAAAHRSIEAMLVEQRRASLEREELKILLDLLIAIEQTRGDSLRGGRVDRGSVVAAHRMLAEAAEAAEGPHYERVRALLAGCTGADNIRTSDPFAGWSRPWLCTYEHYAEALREWFEIGEVRRALRRAKGSARMSGSEGARSSAMEVAE